MHSLFHLHNEGIESDIERRALSRQAHWTEALALGRKPSFHACHGETALGPNVET